MKKTFMLLLLSALGVWAYVVVQIIAGITRGQDASVNAPSLRHLPGLAGFARPPLELDTALRDPFQSYLYAQKPAPVHAAVKKASAPPPLPPSKVIDPPAAVVNGILGGNPPVAILKQGGATELVKPGSEIWGFTVLRIEGNQVVIRKQGREYTLGY